MGKCTVTVLAGVVSILAVSLASGQETRRIGQVESLRKDANRSGKPIALGDAVFQNEVMATGVDSSVRLTFVDQTNLAIGPTSRVTLARFVYNASTQEMALTLTRGAFRFVSGNLDKRSYRVETPTATMGIRGTIIDINVAADGSSTFTSFEGTATIAPK